ncbi:MAG: ribonuclease P protein component 3 [Candidatus Methanospirareceae archaeon]
MKYFDLNIHAYPETETEYKELYRVARRYGYAGIAITNHDDAMGKEGVCHDYTDYIFNGVEIRAESASELKRKIKEWRRKALIVAVHGGNEDINRVAVRNPKVDILAHPLEGEGNLDHTLVRYASENNVAIEFNINMIIQSKRSNRARILSKMRQNLKLVRKYKAKMIITSNAHSIYDMRAPREMIALSSLFGMTREEAIKALSEVPEGIIKRKWKRDREVEVIQN